VCSSSYFRSLSSGNRRRTVRVLVLVLVHAIVFRWEGLEDELAVRYCIDSTCMVGCCLGIDSTFTDNVADTSTTDCGWVFIVLSAFGMGEGFRLLMTFY
jgi:uncharacterized membrane protein